MKKIIFATCLVALLAASPVMAQADFSNYIALGDSMTAGLASGSLMDWYQVRSYPALLSQQAGAPIFEAPLVSEPGIAPILELVSLQGPVIAPVGLIPGLPTNAAYPGIYNNLAVPTATLEDMIFTTGDITNLLQGNFDNVMHDLVLRNGINTALEFALGAQPTFVTVWIGNNDILGAGLAGTPIDGITMTPVDVFEFLYNNAIGVLVTNTDADIVLINIPGDLPFFSTVPPMVEIPGLGIVPLMADTGPLTANDMVNLSAGALIQLGYGLPGGPPLRDNLDPFTGQPGYVIREAEQDIIQGRIAAYNGIIAAAAETYGLVVVDANALFRSWVSNDPPVFGGVTLNGSFLQGGIFSYDGIHLQNIGSALVAAEVIDVINAEFGANIPPIDMVTVLYEGDWQDPGVIPSKIEDVVFSEDAFDQLYEIFKPKNFTPLPRLRRLEDGESDRPSPQLRRRPVE